MYEVTNIEYIKKMYKLYDIYKRLYLIHFIIILNTTFDSSTLYGLRQCRSIKMLNYGECMGHFLWGELKHDCST